MKTPIRTPFAPLAALILILALPLVAGVAQAQQPASAPAVDAAPAIGLDLPAPDALPAEKDEGDVGERLLPDAIPQCIQITVWAQDPETGECHEFPNPCSVPDGWNRSFDPETCTNW